MVRATIRALQRGYGEVQRDPESAVSAMLAAEPRLDEAALAAQLDAVDEAFTAGAQGFGRCARTSCARGRRGIGSSGSCASRSTSTARSTSPRRGRRRRREGARAASAVPLRTRTWVTLRARHELPLPYQHGFARIAACTTPVAIADPPANAEAVLAPGAGVRASEGVAVAVFPELCLTGYSIEDLLLQDAVLDGAEAALATWSRARPSCCRCSSSASPLRHRNRVYNCAAVVHRGRLLGVVPKSYLPTYREFYERRQLASGADERGTIRVAGAEVPFGPDLLFAAEDVPGLVVHAEICEDMWVPVPPSAEAALAGATVLLNLSGSPITVGRAEDRKLLCRSASSRCLAAYAYAAAGQGESTTDLSWDGQTMIYENGVLLAETERFPDGDRRSVADVDLDLLARSGGGWGRSTTTGGTHADAHRRVPPDRASRSTRPAATSGCAGRVERFPFVPADPARLELDCYEAYNIQVAGLQQRLEAIGGPKVVIGVSGGLDSTQALLVAAQAMDRAGRPRSDILGFTLPGFATSEGTKAQRAPAHATRSGVTAAEIDITPDRAADARGDRASVRRAASRSTT